MKGIRHNWSRSICLWKLAAFSFWGICWGLLSSCDGPGKDLADGKDARILRIFNDTLGATGSGFVVSDEGHVITNCHVICGDDFTLSDQKLKEIEVYICWAGEEEGAVSVKKARVLNVDRAKDLALLIVKDFEAEPLALHMGEDLVEENVRAFGYPSVADAQGGGLTFWQALKNNNYGNIPPKDNVDDFVSLTVTKGTVENVREEKFGNRSRDIPSVRHGASIGFGNSGGPLLNDCNEVVGVNTQVKNDEATGRIQAAVHVNALHQFLTKADVPFVEGGSSCNPYLGVIIWSSIGLSSLLLLLVGGVVYLKKSDRRFTDVRNQIVQNVTKVRHNRKASQPKDLLDQLMDGVGGQVSEALVFKVIQSSEPHAGIEISLNDFMRNRNRILIGRSSTLSHRAIADQTISKQHLAIARVPTGFVVEDLGAANGSWLDDRRLDPGVRSRNLRTGDRLKLGNVILVAELNPS